MILGLWTLWAACADNASKEDSGILYQKNNKKLVDVLVASKGHKLVTNFRCTKDHHNRCSSNERCLSTKHSNSTLSDIWELP